MTKSGTKIRLVLYQNSHVDDCICVECDSMIEKETESKRDSEGSPSSRQEEEPTLKVERSKLSFRIRTFLPWIIILQCPRY